MTQFHPVPKLGLIMVIATGAAGVCCSASTVYAAETAASSPTSSPAPVLAPAPAPAASAPSAEPSVPAKKIEVNSLKQKYWANGNGPDLSVVQNRIYTKAGKFSFELEGGTLGADPFLTTYTYGAQLGYNFSEYLAVNALYWKVTNSPSSANSALQVASGFGANTNPISSFAGAEIMGSILYGKLSLLGKSIIHFDLYGLAGAGQLSAANGSSTAPWIGIGQQIYLKTWMSLKVDYRYLRYSEHLVENFRPGSIGADRGTRTTYASAISLGLNFLFL